MALTRFLRTTGVFTGELNRLQSSCLLYLQISEEKQRYEYIEEGIKALATMINPQIAAFLDKEAKHEENGITQWMPSNEAEALQAIEDLRSLGLAVE